MLKSQTTNAVYTSTIFTQEAAQGDWAEYTPKLTTQIESLFVLDSSTQNELHTEKEVQDGEELIVHDGTSFKVGNATGVIYDAELTPPKDINNASYTGNSSDLTTLSGNVTDAGMTYDNISKSISYDTNVRSIAIAPNGGSVIVVRDNTHVDQYFLSTPWDLSTMSSTADITRDYYWRFESGGSSFCYGAQFSSDGSKFYVEGKNSTNGGPFIQFRTASPFTINNSGLDIERSGISYVPADVFFNEDGKIGIHPGGRVTTVFSPFDYRTIYKVETSDNPNFDSIQGFSTDGLKFIRSASNTLIQHSLSSPYDIFSYKQETSIQLPEFEFISCAAFSDDGTKILVGGSDGGSDRIIRQYSLSRPFFINNATLSIPSSNFKTVRAI